MRESAKNTKVVPLLCQQTLDLRRKPIYIQLLYLTSIRYSQEDHELKALQAGHIFLPAHKFYLKNYETNLNSVLPLAVYIKSRRVSFIYHPSNKRKNFYSNETIQCTENI